MKKMITGYLYFYVHFILEVVCFFYLSRVTNNSEFVFIVPFIYDALAFVPQALIGYVSDKYSNINIGLIGIILLLIAYLLYGFNISVYLSLIVLSIGNAFVHVAGAEDTIRSSNGKLSVPALFVSGGSFGIVVGRLIAKTSINPLFLIILILTMIPFVFISKNNSSSAVKNYDYVKENIDSRLVIIISILVVAVRSYMGYGIPTSWNKTMTQTILLFSIMGIGKALGGFLSDRIGIRKVAIYSTIISVPFLCFGNNNMFISLIGIMLFSMTMAITLGILVSKLKKNPGVAFGLTTIGLFLGSLPMFFVRLNMQINVIIIVVMSILCAIALGYILKEDK